MLTVNQVEALRPVAERAPAASAPARPPDDPRLPEDEVTLSPEARQALEAQGRPAGRAGDGRAGQGRLDAKQAQEVADLQRRDLHVRQHEAAHQAAGGDLTGPARFTYRTGPDGRSYAVGGEVPIAARSGRTPDETIAIARRVRAAALAPADPSAADLAAAASAAQLEQKAQAQKRAARDREPQARGADGAAAPA